MTTADSGPKRSFVAGSGLTARQMISRSKYVTALLPATVRSCPVVGASMSSSYVAKPNVVVLFGGSVS
jgi:hypothetical protein